MRLRDLFEIKSDKMELNLSTRLEVFKYFWYTASSSDHGGVIEKKSCSLCLAWDHVMPSLMSLELGCLTQYQLFSKVSFSFRMKGIQFVSSPVGIRSGLVRTPSILTKLRDSLDRITGMNVPIVRFPSGPCCFESLWAPWFSKSAEKTS